MLQYFFWTFEDSRRRKFLGGISQKKSGRRLQRISGFEKMVNFDELPGAHASLIKALSSICARLNRDMDESSVVAEEMEITDYIVLPQVMFNGICRISKVYRFENLKEEGDTTFVHCRKNFKGNLKLFFALSFIILFLVLMQVKSNFFDVHNGYTVIYGVMASIIVFFATNKQQYGASDLFFSGEDRILDYDGVRAPIRFSELSDASWNNMLKVKEAEHQVMVAASPGKFDVDLGQTPSEESGDILILYTKIGECVFIFSCSGKIERAATACSLAKCRTWLNVDE